MEKNQSAMKREELILAAMSVAGCADYQPVQVQKLFFLIDKTIGHKIGGPFFNFQPYDYGPFDKDVYITLERLELEGLVEIVYEYGFSRRRFRLTPTGLAAGKKFFSNLPEDLKEYISKLVEAIRRLSFAQLVSAIYKAYPEMQKYSVFSE